MQSSGPVAGNTKMANRQFLPLDTFDFSHMILCDSAEGLLTTSLLKHRPELFGHQWFKISLHNVAHLCKDSNLHSSSPSSNVTLRYVQPELTLMKGVSLDLLGNMRELGRLFQWFPLTYVYQTLRRWVFASLPRESLPCKFIWLMSIVTIINGCISLPKRMSF